MATKIYIIIIFVVDWTPSHLKKNVPYYHINTYDKYVIEKFVKYQFYIIEKYDLLISIYKIPHIDAIAQHNVIVCNLCMYSYSIIFQFCPRLTFPSKIGDPCWPQRL